MLIIKTKTKLNFGILRLKGAKSLNHKPIISPFFYQNKHLFFLSFSFHQKNRNQENKTSEDRLKNKPNPYYPSMAVRHALVLLLMLAPLLVTATFTVEPTDAVFERDHHGSDELSHDIFEWGPESYDDGINRLTDEVRLGFIGHKMPTCHAGACDVSSEIWRELSFRRR